MPQPTLLELVTRGMDDANPAKPALVSSDRVVTYEELRRGATGIASALSGAGVGPGSRVGVWMDKTPLAVESLLGVLLAGAAYVPLDPRSPWQRTRTIAQDCQLAALVADAPRLPVLRSVLDDLKCPAPRLLIMDGPDGPDSSQLAEAAGGRAWESLQAARARPGRSLRYPAPDDLAYILYTSGSTGTPKGVAHTHASGGAFVDWFRNRFSTGPGDVFSSHAPFHFDLSIADLWAALASGATIRVLSSLEAMLAPYLARMLGKWEITVWYSVPSILVAMLEAGLASTPPETLRLLLFAGEVFPTPHLRRLRQALPRAELFNLFGPTETNVCTYYQVPAELPEHGSAPIPIGRGCENLETFVIDDEGHEVRAPGREGTLWARGGNLMTGYWADPERTARMLQPDPRGREGLACCTGDRVRLLPSGDYEFLGRRDHMIKTRGYRVELGEIEAALVAHADVLEAVATPLPDPALGNRIVATVVLRAGGQADAGALGVHCSERLPSYMVPERIELVPEMPRTSSGKADRGALRGQWERRAV
jgi:amino acid adenylation domain-containing protein